MDDYSIQFSTLINQIDIAVINCSKKLLFTEFKKNSKCSNDISERQFHILYMIEKRNINSTSELASFFHLSKSNISIIVSKLQDMGCISKTYNNSNDGRRHILQVTEKGNEYLHFYTTKLKKDMESSFPFLADNEVNKEIFDILTIICSLTNIEVNRNNLFETILILIIFINIYFENIFGKILKEKNLKISKNDCNLLYMFSTGLTTLEDISSKNNISHSTLSIQINSLIKKGLIKQTTDKNDRRKKHFKLSSVATSNLKDIFDRRTFYILKDIEHLSKQEKQQVLISCEKILKILNICVNRI